MGGQDAPGLTRDGLVDRLAELPELGDLPRGELEWLATHGEPVRFEPGDVPAPAKVQIRYLWIILSGRIAVRVDHGSGPRNVVEWRAGEVTGMLPYSRMTAPPGDNFAVEPTDCVQVAVGQFPELIRQCPRFTAYTVHLMLDRARSFSAAQLHDEKMISLGRLAAGLAHELNNPASATMRGAKTLLHGLMEGDTAARALGALGLTSTQTEILDRLRSRCVDLDESVLSPIERADRQDAIEDWLDSHGANPAVADPLADTSLTIADLDALAGALDEDALDVALRWLAAGCTLNSLATDIDQAATRIHELVAAVKSFTYMDRLAGSEQVDVARGLRDTLRVINSKTKAKNAAITLDVEPELPAARANGGELNQVWLNLIDNALDAIAESGRIEIAAKREVDRVVVFIIDDGPGVPPEIAPRIFDAFFTTKAPGEGTGLGLEIARRLVQRHGGTINLDSRPGRTAFRVSLIAAGRGPAVDERQIE